MTADIPIRIPGMILIGSMGRNTGKTELACALIQKITEGKKVVCLKVSTIHHANGACARGNAKGCGVCSSLKGDWCLEPELSRDGKKDTSKMLLAGADEVYWLRARPTALVEGVTEFLRNVGSDSIIICESNSLRQVVSPGVFLLMRNVRSSEEKPSAKQVAAYADRMVTFDGNRFDLDLDDVSVVGTEAVIRKRCTAILLAGGKSRRMGTNKALLPLNGTSMIQHILTQLRPLCTEILISSAESGHYGDLPFRKVVDRYPDSGPFGGIVSGLEAARNHICLVSACDIPHIGASFVIDMINEGRKSEVVVPKSDDGKLEPLFAVYTRSVIGRMRELLLRGEFRMRKLFPLCYTTYFPAADVSIIKNLNTRDEYETYVTEQS